MKGGVGDDLVALNAYDWLNSSVNFGPQRNILCEDLELVGGGYPAIRIQPAKFKYKDGSVVDCAISDVIFRKVKGIMTFKMYLQTPRYYIGKDPEWSAVGTGGNLFFEDIDIDLRGPIDCMGQYKESEPLRGHFGAFEFGADLSSVHFRDIRIAFHLDKYPLSHLAVVLLLPAEGRQAGPRDLRPLRLLPRRRGDGRGTQGHRHGARRTRPRHGLRRHQPRRPLLRPRRDREAHDQVVRCSAAGFSRPSWSWSGA